MMDQKAKPIPEEPTRPMGAVTARLAADPIRAEWLRQCVASAPPMAPEDILFAQRILFTPTAAEVAAARRRATASKRGQ
jgi:hypothetical protein